MNEITTHMLLSPGTVLDGGYQIIRLIGKGGMGTVYMAYDTRLDLKVAIKVISLGCLKTSEYEATLKRFQAEARIVAQIDHPNVIRIYGLKQDTIEYEGQQYNIDYLVMELMAERTLRDTMDESGFEFEEEVRSWIKKFMIPVLGGLEEVHKRGIVHRDIKPENIFLKENSAKLADFGLSMGFDFPSVTGSVIEIFGTLAYMAPEQYNNFSLARESADIFAIGRILFEVVEGKITEKVTPFKQVQLTNFTSEYYKSLNYIIMIATADNPMERIGSVRELKDRLIDIHECPLNVAPVPKENRLPSWKIPALWVVLLATIISFGGFTVKYYIDGKSIALPNPQQSLEKPYITSKPPIQATGKEPVYGLLPKGLKPLMQSKENSLLHLIPSMALELEPDNPFAENRISIDAFYLAESPVTNEQYVEFLNANLDRIKYIDNDIHLDGHLILKLSEKIRGYKPIAFNGKSFFVQRPMHMACAVLMVTGYGAEAYARFYGFRLVTAREWFSLLMTNGIGDAPRLPLPTPVINYPQKKFGIRGINQIAEWGKSAKNDFVILGQSVSSMLGSKLILETDPSKYFTDTSFRLAKDAAPQ